MPEALKVYTESAKGGPEWDQVMHGRATVWSVAIGHVHLLHPTRLMFVGCNMSKQFQRRKEKYQATT